MGTLRDYVNQEIYDQKDNYTGDDYILGKSRENWIKPIAHGDKEPTRINIYVRENAFIGDSSIVVTADIPCTLYRGDVLNFDSCFVVIDETVSLSPMNKSISVLPITGDLIINKGAQTYAMIPVLSISNTDNADISGENTDAQNKSQGIWKSSRTVVRNGTIELGGSLLKSDPALELLKRFSTSGRTFFFESRYHPFIVMNTHDGIIEKGEGPGTYKGLVNIVDYQEIGSNDDFILVSYSLAFSSRAFRYKVLEPLFIEPNNYCPLNADSLYFVDYEVIPKEDNSGYCPLDITGFYDFTSPP